MDWSIIGREAKKALKDIIDQSFGTHFFSSSTLSATQSNTQSQPVEVKSEAENNSDPERSAKDLEAAKALELKQRVEKDRVRAELEEAIAQQREKRMVEQEQIEQIRQESLQKPGIGENEKSGVSGGPNVNRNLPTKEQLDAVSKE